MIWYCVPTRRTSSGSSTPFSRIEAVSSSRSPSAWRGWSGFGAMSSIGIRRPMVSPLGRTSWSTKCGSCRMRSASGRPIRRGLDTFDDLLAELVVLVGATRLGSEREDRLAMRRAFLEPDALRNRRLQDAITENLAHGLVHVLRQRRPLVVERDDGAEKLELGIRARADAVDRLEQVVGPFEREVARLDGNQQVRRGHQRVHGDEAERRRTGG